MAASVLVAVGEVDHIVDEICNQANAVKLGEDLGAITNASSVERITGYIDRAEVQVQRFLLMVEIKRLMKVDTGLVQL